MLGNGSSITVNFRELILTSFASAPTLSTFNLVGTIDLNPGLKASFPWLSTIAANYDQYMVKKVTYEYVNAAPATRQGFIYMVPDYDVYDAAPTTPQGAMNQMGSVSTPVWSSASLSIRVAAAMSVGPRRFIRQAASGRDQSLTDVCKLHLFYSDMASADPLPGQLWVDYSIVLYAPQMIPSQLQPRVDSDFDVVTVTPGPYESNTDYTMQPIISAAANGLKFIGVAGTDGFYVNGLQILKLFSTFSGAYRQDTQAVDSIANITNGWKVYNTRNGTLLDTITKTALSFALPGSTSPYANFTANTSAVFDARNYSAPANSSNGHWVTPTFSMSEVTGAEDIFIKGASIMLHASAA